MTLLAVGDRLLTLRRTVARSSLRRRSRSANDHPGKFVAMTLKAAVADRWSSVARHRAHDDLSAELDLMGEQIRG